MAGGELTARSWAGCRWAEWPVILLGRLHGADRGWEAGNGKSLKSLMCVGGVNETLDRREGGTGEVIR